MAKKTKPTTDLAEIARLRIEVEELTADRDRWMLLYYQAANEVLRLSPPTRFTSPLLNLNKLQGEGASEIVNRGRDECLRIAEKGLGLSDQTAQAMANHGFEQTTTLSELWATIDTGPRALEEFMPIEGVDPLREPTMDEINAEVKAVRNARRAQGIETNSLPHDEAWRNEALRTAAELLPPRDRARALLEARIQILMNEAVATSAIAGVTLDPKEVRKAVLQRLAAEEGLL
jgi:hypothetical protein